MKKKVIVVGAGIGGLGTAALLAKKGYRVTVIEKNDQPGGRAMAWKEKDFVFDMGPSWYLMPEVFERFFSEFGMSPKDYYDLKRLDPAYRVFYEGEGSVDVHASKAEVLRLFDSFEEDGGEKLRKYLRDAEHKYDALMKKHLYKDYLTKKGFLSLQTILEARSLDVFSSMDSHAKRFFSSEKARKMLEHRLLFLGGSPEKTPAVYSIMSHADFNLGVYYPQGGFAKLIGGIGDLCNSLRVRFVYGQEVKHVSAKEGKVTGVSTDQRMYDASYVVVNADYAHAETHLLKKEERTYDRDYWEKKTIAPSAVLMYLGIDKKINGLVHHNLFLAKDWSKHFKDIYEDPKWPKHPSYYVGCPSKTDASVAPEGCENLFVLVPVAAGLEDTEEIKETYFEMVMEDMEKALGQEILSHVVVKRMLAHSEFRFLFNAYEGTALGLAQTLRQTAMLRPSHRSKEVENLFYVGQYTHPGIGLPMSLISAKIVADEITLP